MKLLNFSPAVKKATFFIGIFTIIPLLGIPAIAQTNNQNQTPDTTTPDTTTPGTNQTPDTTTPDTTTPGTNQTPSPSSTPPTGGSTPQNNNTSGAGNLLEVAAGAGSFKILTQAIQAAGLENTLNSGSYTIFAPTDQAFANSLPPGALELLLQPQNRDLLRQVLSYHVVPREVASNRLRSGSLRTLGGGLAVRVSPERVIVNNASVVQPDIQASNGVIHAVNRVLLPTNLRQRIASQLQTQSQQ